MVREDSQRDEALTRIAGDLFQTLTVATGPFEGLRYPGCSLPGVHYCLSF
jgi:hypothetical protein